MQQTTQSHKHKQGFSLVELLVVMAIIAILMGIVIGISGGVTRGAAEAQAKAQIADLMMELEKYRGDKGQFPANWSEFRDWYVDRYPQTEYTLTEGSPQDPIDPWGKTYVYHYDPSVSPFVYLIGTRGPDGRYGSEGDDTGVSSFGKGDDITNRNGAL